MSNGKSSLHESYSRDLKVSLSKADLSAGVRKYRSGERLAARVKLYMMSM